MSCVKVLVKYSLFFINFFITMIGLALIGYGSYGFYYLSNIDRISIVNAVLSILGGVDRMKHICLAIIALGGVIFIITFCGCCGSIAENKSLLFMYSIVMLLLAGASIGVILVLQSGGPPSYKDTAQPENSVLRKLGTKIGLVTPSCCSTFDTGEFLKDPKIYTANNFKCIAKHVYLKDCRKRVYHFFVISFEIVWAIIAGVLVLVFLFTIFLYLLIKPKDGKSPMHQNDKNLDTRC